jgi:hypothetical protein
MPNSNQTNAAKALARTLKRTGPSEAVSRFLSKYGPVMTRRGYAEALFKYFEWLKSIGVDLTPDRLITENLANVFKSDPTDVVTERRHTDWLLQYVNRYTIDKGYSQGYRVHAATVIRRFYARNDSALYGDFQVSYERPKEVSPRPSAWRRIQSAVASPGSNVSWMKVCHTLEEGNSLVSCEVAE